MSWRSSSVKVLNTRPIYEKEWPKLISAMEEDGLLAILGDNGIILYLGRYVLKPKQVREAWELSVSQMRRFNEYIMVNDPFQKNSFSFANKDGNRTHRF